MRTAIGDQLARKRRASGLSRRQVARAAHIGARRIREIERGAPATEAELAALAHTLGTTVGALQPMGHDLVLVQEQGRLHGDEAIDALLREYVAMVRELRSAVTVPRSSVRHEDLVELGRALGGSPQAIEARLIDLLATDAADAQRLRDAILPSSRPSSPAAVSPRRERPRTP